MFLLEPGGGEDYSVRRRMSRPYKNMYDNTKNSSNRDIDIRSTERMRKSWQETAENEEELRGDT